MTAPLLDQGEASAIADGRHGSPFAVLGQHVDGDHATPSAALTTSAGSSTAATSPASA